jgi:heptosyltransferase-1
MKASSKSPLKILIVRVSSLGDVVHNMPMLADLRHYYPDAQIDWVVEEGYVELVRLNQNVAEVIPFALRRWRKSLLSKRTRDEIRAFIHALKGRTYDFVFDTQGLLKTAIVMRLARVRAGGHRIGLANATAGSGYEPLSRILHTDSITVGLHTHAVERARLVASGALGYRLEGSAVFALAPPLVSSTAASWLPAVPYAVFFHGTARAEKQWDMAKWIATGRHVIALGIKILLPWGSMPEQVRAQALAAAIDGAVVLPHLSMMDALLLAQRAALVIGVDSGLTHIAAAYERPTIELYCDSPRWKTEGNWSSNIVNLGDQGTAPTVAEVTKGIDLLLEVDQKSAASMP